MTWRELDLPEGWLFDEEADALAELATGRNVLELGAYKGRSAVVMATTAKQVTSVDWHQGDDHIGVQNTWTDYLSNIKDFPNIVPIKGRINEVVKTFSENQFDLIYIDAGHEFDDVIHDMTAAIALNPSQIAVHDWGLFDVEAALLAMDLEPTRIVRSLAIFGV